MQPSYRTTGQIVTPIMQKLCATAEYLDRKASGERAQDIARRYGTTRQTLHKNAGRLRRALEPKKPGPPPRWRETEIQASVIHTQAAIIAEQRVRIDQLHSKIQRAVQVDPRRIDAVNLTCAVLGIGIRSTQELLRVALGEEHAPRLQDIQENRKEFGRKAREILNQVEVSVGPRLNALAADEIYLNGKPVHLVVEPRSVAILGIGRSDSSTAEDWELWLSPYSSLEVLISDLGTGLIAGAAGAGVAHQADYFHEKRWFDRHLLEPVGRTADRAWSSLQDLRRRAARAEGPERRISPSTLEEAERESMEADHMFFDACTVVEKVDALFQPADPTTAVLWSEAGERRWMEGIQSDLQRILHPAAAVALRHLRRYGHHYGTWRWFFDRIPVKLRREPADAKNASCLRREVVEEMMRLGELERALQGESVYYADVEIIEVGRRIRRLEGRLSRLCSNVSKVREDMARLHKYPLRSSSCVESLNSVVRTMQTTHRNVSDAMLALKALAWNLRPRRHAGPRGHRSPYEMLGVKLIEPWQSWMDVLLSPRIPAAG